jgi:hypothetical protein
MIILLTTILLSTTTSSFPLNFTNRSTMIPKLSATQYETPVQWNDFIFNKGSEGSKGELITNNDINYAIINPGTTQTWGSETYLAYIKPGTQGSESNADLLTQWDNADGIPHWSKIKEKTPVNPGVPPSTTGDGGNIREVTTGRDDKWRFTSYTIPSGCYITKMRFWCLMDQQYSDQFTYISFTTSISGVHGFFSSGSTAYTWKDYTKSGLSITQSQLDNFWMNVEPFTMVGEKQGWVDIEAVYVELWYKPLITFYSFDYEIKWDVTNPELLSINYFKYDYRTTSTVNCNLDIYNWDNPTNPWVPLETHATIGWITNSYALTDPYISSNNEVKIRLQTETPTSYFNMEIDQLCLEYVTIENKIVLLSPQQNQIYEEGHYRASYGFENDALYSTPNEWINDESGGSVTVIGEMGNNKNIVSLHDTHNSYKVAMSQVISPFSDVGTVEFWASASTNDKSSFLYIKDESIGGEIRLSFYQNGYIAFYDGIYHNIIPYIPYEWYLIKIEFTINEETYFVSIWDSNRDCLGTSFCNYNGDWNVMSTISFETSNGYMDYFFYIDAIGFSWDPGYGINNNFWYGLYIDPELKDLTSIEYQLDWYPWIQISDLCLSGGFYIDLPPVGFHTIKVKGNYYGQHIESDLITFDIGIVNPNPLINRDITYPFCYLKNGHVLTDYLIYFQTEDGSSIHFESGSGLTAIMWFTTPNCVAKKGNSVQMRIKYHNDNLLADQLCLRIFYWQGTSEAYLFTGAKDEYVLALAPILDYKVVNFIVFQAYFGNIDLWIDYLAACYPNADIGISPVNLQIFLN